MDRLLADLLPDHDHRDLLVGLVRLPMSRQPPENSLQFGRENRVRLAADVARKAIEDALQKAADDAGVVLIRPPADMLNLPPVRIDADVPVDMELPFTTRLDDNGDLK